MGWEFNDWIFIFQWSVPLTSKPKIMLMGHNVLKIIVKPDYTPSHTIQDIPWHCMCSSILHGISVVLTYKETGSRSRTKWFMVLTLPLHVLPRWVTTVVRWKHLILSSSEWIYRGETHKHAQITNKKKLFDPSGLILCISLIVAWDISTAFCWSSLGDVCENGNVCEKNCGRRCSDCL